MTVSENQHGYIHRKDDYLKRLRRIEGQARGLQRSRRSSTASTSSPRSPP